MRAAFVVMLLALTSCAGDGLPTTPVRIPLAEAERRWAVNAPAAYQVTVSHGCFCGFDVNRPVIVTVRDGQVESRRYADTGLDVDPRFAGAFPTVDGLFAVIEHAISQNAAQVDVSYDATYGFPVSVALDGSAMIADDEDFYGMRDLAPR